MPPLGRPRRPPPTSPTRCRDACVGSGGPRLGPVLTLCRTNVNRELVRNLRRSATPHRNSVMAAAKRWRRVLNIRSPWSACVCSVHRCEVTPPTKRFQYRFGTMAGTLSDQFKTRLNLQTKTVGEERIKRAKERNEDVAILSMELPGDKKAFKCCLGKDCLFGDPASLPLGVCGFGAIRTVRRAFRGRRFCLLPQCNFGTAKIVFRFVYIDGRFLDRSVRIILYADWVTMSKSLGTYLTFLLWNCRRTSYDQFAR